MEKHEFGNNPEKIKKYLAFWKRENTGKPLVGFSRKSWFPLVEFKASKKWQNRRYLRPGMIEPEAFIEDQLNILKEGEVIEDDIIRGASPSQAIPWLCGIIGGKLRIAPSSIISEEERLPWQDIEAIEIDKKNEWYKKYINFAKILSETSNGRFPVSHGALIGPSDLASILRGHTQHITDYMFEPKKTRNLLWKMANIFKEITELLWKNVNLFHNGYFDAQYSLWSPGSIIRIQEDASAVISPKIYKEFIKPIDRYLAQNFESPFMHLHSSSMFLLDEILEVEEIKCFQVNNDDVSSAPSIEEMIKNFKKIQRAERSLIIRGSFTDKELKLLLDSLDPAGIYLYIMIKDLREYETLKKIIDN